MTLTYPSDPNFDRHEEIGVASARSFLWQVGEANGGRKDATGLRLPIRKDFFDVEKREAPDLRGDPVQPDPAYYAHFRIIDSSSKGDMGSFGYRFDLITWHGSRYEKVPYESTSPNRRLIRTRGKFTPHGLFEAVQEGVERAERALNEQEDVPE